MVITADDQNTFLNASMIIAVIDTDECRELASALETAAKTGNERSLDQIRALAPDVRRRLLVEASIDAWMPDGWSGSMGEMDAAAALASGRERQANSLKEVLDIFDRDMAALAS